MFLTKFFTISFAAASFGTEACGKNSKLVKVSSTIDVCLPSTKCVSETCPPQLGKCNGDVCEFHSGYKGIETFPEAYVTNYCTLSSGGCQGVTQIEDVRKTAATVAKNLNFPLCEGNSDAPSCVGIAASSPMIVGNSQNSVLLGDLWGQGMTEYTGVCYELTSKNGKKAIVALTDRCGGYCKCGGSGLQECGPCVIAPEMALGCPCVGTVPGLFNTCCGLSQYHCEMATSQTCDWCASNNHPHFDLDLGSYNAIGGSDVPMGSYQLSAVKPIKCMEPLAWPPGSATGPECDKDCSHCVAIPNNPAGASDEACKPCGGPHGQTWWPCNNKPQLCQCEKK